MTRLLTILAIIGLISIVWFRSDWASQTEPAPEQQERKRTHRPLSDPETQTPYHHGSYRVKRFKSSVCGEDQDSLMYVQFPGGNRYAFPTEVVRNVTSIKGALERFRRPEVVVEDREGCAENPLRTNSVDFRFGRVPWKEEIYPDAIAVNFYEYRAGRSLRPDNSIGNRPINLCKFSVNEPAEPSRQLANGLFFCGEHREPPEYVPSGSYKGPSTISPEHEAAGYSYYMHCYSGPGGGCRGRGVLNDQRMGFDYWILNRGYPKELVGHIFILEENFIKFDLWLRDYLKDHFIGKFPEEQINK